MNITKIEEHPTSIIIDDHAIDNEIIHNNKFHHNQQIDFESSSMIMKPATTLLALDLIIMNNNNQTTTINLIYLDLYRWKVGGGSRWNPSSYHHLESIV